jgi:hypothetical protein
MVHRALGSKPPQDFVQDGRTANNPDKNYRALSSRFNEGERDDTAMLKQLIAVSSEADPKLSEEALDAYWTLVPNRKLIRDENWTVFKYYENDPGSKAYKYIYAHKESFAKKYTAKTVDNILYGKAANAVRTAADNKDENLFKRARTIAMLSNDTNVRQQEGMNELRFYRKMDRWNDYLAFADTFLSRYGNTSNMYNSVSWEIVSNTDNKDALQKALVYAEQSMKLGKDYGNTDTYANVLYKLNRSKDAEAAALDAIELAKKEKLDFSSTQELLDKVRASAGK